MTTEGRVACAVLGLLAWAGLGPLACASLRQERRGDTVDVSRDPPHIQRAYRVFALRCSRCHTLARPLNARIHDPQHWIRYVQRMRRQPGSGIDHSNADLILTFLLHYHQRQQEPPPQEVEQPQSDTAPTAAPDPVPGPDPDPDPDPDPGPNPTPVPAATPPPAPPPAAPAELPPAQETVP